MAPIDDLPERMKTADVARVLGVSRRSVNDLLSQPDDPLPGYRLRPGGRWFVDRDKFIEWYDRRPHN